MFGYKTIRARDFDALNAKINGLEQEVKGYYENREAGNEYFRAIAPLLQGVSISNGILVVDRKSIKQAYETIAPVYGIINKIAKATGDVFPYLELLDRKTNDQVENHWLLDLLARPNDRYNLQRFGTMWATFRLAYGDSWVYAPKSVGKELGTGKEMYIIPSHRVEVQRGGYLAPIKGIKVKGGGSVDTILPEDFFESFNTNLDDTSFFGTSPLVVAAVYLSVIDKGMNRQDKSLENGGPTALVTPKPDNLGVLPVTADTLTEELNGREVKGQIKALRTAIEMHELGKSPVDLGILTSHKEAVNALCFIYDIPVDLYYGQAKYENMKEAKKALYENNAIPLANEFGADLLSHFGLDRDYKLVVNTDYIDVLKEKATDTLDCLTKMCATLNEKREAYGYDPRPEPWADQPMIPIGTMFGNETFDIDETGGGQPTANEGENA